MCVATHSEPTLKDPSVMVEVHSHWLASMRSWFLNSYTTEKKVKGALSVPRALRTSTVDFYSCNAS